MKYYSTKRLSKPVSLKDAVINCISPDGGLYMPCEYPKLPKAFFNNMQDMTLKEIAYVISNIFLGEDIDSSEIKKIVDDTYTFDTPLVKLDNNRYILELFHGPTNAFKDVGTKFLARLTNSFNPHNGTKLNVLTTSTGNTGKAVAEAFGNISDTNVFILYPHGYISNEDAAATACDNVHIIEVAGNIDDCKSMTDAIFTDQKLRESISLTTANSMNIARLIPQIAILFYASCLLRKNSINPGETAFSMPSGNFSLLTSGLMAKRIGLPCGRLIAACNENNMLKTYLETGKIETRPTVRTLARFIDMSKPSNLERILDLCDNSPSELRNVIDSVSIDDETIKATIRSVFDKSSHIIDPHAAVGLAALEQCTDRHKTGLVFATAHPSKSANIINEIIGSERVKASKQNKTAGRRKIIRISPTYPALKKIILSNQ